METEKMQINFAPGQSTAEIIIREGVATKQLDPKVRLRPILSAQSEQFLNT